MANITQQAETRKRPRPKRRSKVLVLHGPFAADAVGDPVLGPPGSAREIIATIDARLTAKAKSAAIELIAFQSDHEDALIERVLAAADEGVGFIVIDPAGLTHSSVSLRAALSSAAIPFIEVHLANVHAREPFRQRSVASDKVVGTIAGLGAHGYELALTYALRQVKG